MEYKEKIFEKVKLKSADQLPDIIGDSLDFIWECIEGKGTYGSDTLILYNNVVLWCEPAVYEGWWRFNQIKPILEAKYGSRFHSLTPTRGSGIYLYGDALSSPDRISFGPSNDVLPNEKGKQALTVAPNIIQKAVIYATRKHLGQIRKVDGLPYIIHPIIVALKLAQLNFSDSVIAAALLHDVIEDTNTTVWELEKEFGEEITKIVEAVTNDDSLSWEEKKKKYVETVRNGPEGAKAISVADKIHNLESLLAAYSEQGKDIWKKFNRGKEQKIWFEDEMLKMLKETWQHPLVDEYEKLLDTERELE